MRVSSLKIGFHIDLWGQLVDREGFTELVATVKYWIRKPIHYLLQIRL